MGGSPLDRFVGELFDGRLLSAVQVAERGRSVGFDPTDRCVIALLVPRTARDAPALRDAGRRITERFDGTAVAVRREPRIHLPLVLRPATSPSSVLTELASVVPANVVAFVAEVPLTEVSATYATLAVELDLARASGQRVVQSVDLTTERVLRETGLPTAFDFVRAVIGPVLSDRNARALLYTLEQALAWNGPLKNLDVMPYSTLRNHIDRIETLTGLRLTRPRDRVLLDTAIRLYRLNEEALPEPGKRWRAMAAAG
jgi:hypothetical protein